MTKSHPPFLRVIEKLQSYFKSFSCGAFTPDFPSPIGCSADDVTFYLFSIKKEKTLHLFLFSLRQKKKIPWSKLFHGLRSLYG